MCSVIPNARSLDLAAVECLLLAQATVQQQHFDNLHLVHIKMEDGPTLARAALTLGVWQWIGLRHAPV
jgi:hypothetical protein